MFLILYENLILNNEASWSNIGVSAREGTFGTFQLFFLLVSLILIVLAKAGNTSSFLVVSKIFFQARRTESQIKEGWPLLASPAWFLALNFVITFAHSIYLLLGLQQEESLFAVLIALGISLAFFLLAFLAMIMISFLTGLKSIYQIPIQTTWVLPQFMGLVFFLINLIWVLNPSFSNTLIIIMLAMFFVLSFKRILRSSLFLLKKGVEWYYILLYLCTLEILPLSILAWFLYKWML